MEDLAQEEFGPVVSRMIEKFLWGIFFNNPAEIHEHHPWATHLANPIS